MLKPRSMTAAAKKQISLEDIEGLARDLVDKPYGEPAEKKAAPKPENPKVIAKAKPVTISLPPSLIEKLEDTALRNKRRGEGPKTVSAIVREALELAGHNS
ncbi:MAG: hypothetical protein ACOH2I_05595 [Pseudomonas sp.]